MECVVCASSTEQLDEGLYRCNNCKHIYVDYQGDGLTYHKEEYRTNNEGNRVKGEVSEGKFTPAFHAARKKIMTGRCDFLQDKLEGCSNLLDIGAGGGTFALHARERFSTLEVECQEISDICANNLTEYGFKVHHGDINALTFTQKYDVVTCWHVLEHIKDLHSYAKNVSALVNKKLIIEVPIDRRLRVPGQGRWDGHYHFFTRESFRILFGEHFSEINYYNGIQSPALLVELIK